MYITGTLYQESPRPKNCKDGSKRDIRMTLVACPATCNCTGTCRATRQSSNFHDKGQNVRLDSLIKCKHWLHFFDWA
ncbi:hypothetical protein DPMN_102422 [Dreissena polymorpha]|uniref:Uncharacterized protein n=1 Tax=Dreissena polymorpha TaxID=45954 RepID=A0A9D4RAV4_DREPO|nr:hypothetical protein DPMN_102422 [Dreissena polymorpha]